MNESVYIGDYMGDDIEDDMSEGMSDMNDMSDVESKASNHISDYL